MNFKQYHLSKNLFSCNLEQGTISMQGEYRDANDRVRSDNFIIMETGEYTINGLSESGTLRVFVFEFMEDGTFVTRTPPDWANVPYTFSLAGKRKMKFVFSYSSGNIMPTAVDSVMLNTGSSALPYEPYSPEVWHNIPHYIHNTSTDTITTPAVLYLNDTTATISIKGNTVQNGTPTPTTPIQPSECGGRTGNLFDYQTMTVSETNKYLNKTGELITDNSWNVSDYIPCNGTEFTISKIGGGSPAICLYDDNKNFVAGKNYNTPYGAQTKTTISISSTTNAKYIRFSYNTATFSDDLSKLLITEGIYTSQTIPEYEPYGYKIPILSANTTTPVYLGEVQSTRKVKKLVFDGSEDWAGFQDAGTRCVARMSLSGTDAGINAIIGYCSHLEWKSSYESSDLNRLSFSSDRVMYLSLESTLLSENSLTAFKAYLAQQYANGTPVTVWYVLATPETGIVNEPLMKIGDYADEVTGITIPTIAGANTIDVDTTLKPSEVTVNYKGWHPVQSVHERENAAWD